MGKTIKEQDQYDYEHDNNDDKIPPNRLYKLLRYFNRLNYWDRLEKVKYRKHKDAKRGGKARLKLKKYRNH